MERVKEILGQIRPLQEEACQRSKAYLKKVLEEAEGKRIDIDEEESGYLWVTYDGGRHPEYNSNVFSVVHGVFLNEQGNICLDIADCEEYEIDRITWDDVVSIAEFVYDSQKRND